MRPSTQSDAPRRAGARPQADRAGRGSPDRRRSARARSRSVCAGCDREGRRAPRPRRRDDGGGVAGPTGVGKSLLFNALPGRARDCRTPPADDVRGSSSGVGRRRGSVAGLARDQAAPSTRRRGSQRTAAPRPAGLRLGRVAHRLEVDRVVALADLVVWVVEPQKYADASLHDRYLRPLQTHGAAMAVVLNQADLLSRRDRRRAPGRLQTPRDDGLVAMPVLVVSARTGEGSIAAPPAHRANRGAMLRSPGSQRT